ncbi:glycosyltransferase involved in cell wall biosynthesis [Phenylobacterium haematophilum]|jgi:glycosyltransferase involved in cell wall biosynthesis|uniref:Glycosyltransferase involved in cell wall biosynthesis n=1 Tax=Phenylobacterium haematophilum TaxID=98513 RepID=A0A840A2D8_9CAUL|nr:glycosyltransferase family 2 protein [Phenylobacterium haematophilum]MBB3891671.1 glycosyltransferase involved in cell wall biosynthesis [Phenylobacterium haematophilum]
MPNLVSVVVPAYNATATLAETLRSALRQTHADLEVIVVDDGSKDGTRALAESFAAEDPRVRVISKPNGGVAAARNAGIDAARGDFIAPLDADDLWHPDKLRLQLERFTNGPASLGLVYNWYRRIDTSGRIIDASAAPVVEGWVLYRHLDWNFVSNGSTPLIRRSALGDLRYDPGLNAANAQGCEDYLIQLQVALKHQFACVPAYLTGYRRTDGAMTEDVGRMIRSHIQMYRVMWPELDDTARNLARRRMATFFAEYARNRARRGLAREALAAVGEAFAHDPFGAPHKLVEQARLAIVYLGRRSTGGAERVIDPRHFDAYSDTEVDTAWDSRRRLQRFRSLAALDAAYDPHMVGRPVS